MLVTNFTKRALAVRREDRSLRSQGYRKRETDWEILRGTRYDEVILDVKISVDGKHVWTKIGYKKEGSDG